MRMKTLLPALCFAAAILPPSAQETEAGIQGGNELRPRIDYTRIDGGSFSLSSLNSTTTVQAVGVGIDYLRYLEGRRRGSYAVAGIELNWWESQYRFRGSDRETSPSLMVGVGHRFNSSWSMEFNLDWGQFRSYVGTASDIKGGVFYRF